MPGRGRPIREETTNSLWWDILSLPLLLALMMIVPTFASESGEGPWPLWLVCSVLSVFCWLLSFGVAVPRVRELGRRGEWLPPGLKQRPVLATAGYVAALMLAGGVAEAGVVFGLAWALPSSGLIR